MLNRFRSFLKFAFAVLASLTLASAASAQTSRNLAVTVVNGTTTPAPEGEQLGAGFLPVSCDGQAYQPIDQDQTVVVNCQVQGTEALTLTYAVHLGNDQLHYGTADIDCRATATLTFTGSGTGVTFTQSSCDDDSDGGDDSGSDGGDDGGDTGD